MKDEHEYCNRITKKLQHDNAALQSKIDTASKTILSYTEEKEMSDKHQEWLTSEVKNYRDWNKVLFFVCIALVLIIFFIVSAMEKGRNDFEKVKIYSPSGEMEFISRQMDSIFSGAHPLYPTDTAEVTIKNSFGDSLKVLIMQKH